MAANKNLDYLGFRQSPGDEEARKFDSVVHAVTTIGENHRMIHDGFMFHAYHKHNGLERNGIARFLFDVPANTAVHLSKLRTHASGGDITLTLCEGPTVTDNGTEITAYNPNRVSSNTPDMDVYDGPTITVEGTDLLSHWLPPAGVGQGDASHIVTDESEEWILWGGASGQQYCWSVTNHGSQSIDVWQEVYWYEVGYTT